MAAICKYQNQKNNLNTDEYSHKKFTLNRNKRKHGDMQENKENIITAQSILEQALKDKQPEQPLAKSRQTKSLFRPWEDVGNNRSTNKSNTTTSTKLPKSVSPIPVLSNIPTNVLTYHPNMIRRHDNKSRTDKEQQRRNRNTVASLISRRNKQAEQLMLQQQYIAYQQQQKAMMDESMRAALYLRHLQQIAVQRQKQLFVFGQHY